MSKIKEAFSLVFQTKLLYDAWPRG